MADKRKQILIVEDEVLLALSLSMDLRAAGYAVADTIGTGAEAVERVKDTPVDLVIMDIGLPGSMDGVAAAREIREFSDVPIVFLTGYADRAEDTELARIKPLGFLVKPVSLSRLNPLIESV